MIIDEEIKKYVEQIRPIFRVRGIALDYFDSDTDTITLKFSYLFKDSETEETKNTIGQYKEQIEKFLKGRFTEIKTVKFV